MSVWQETKTFFPLFLEQLAGDDAKTVSVVGASDGKFVLPLARRGLQVRAIERDPLALCGGPVVLPGNRPANMLGLRGRLAAEGLEHMVEVIEADLLDIDDTLEPTDAVWTSCSWHYSANHHRPLAQFINRMTTLCRTPGGIFGAEFMMPVEPRHHATEHYLEAGEIRRYLTGWPILWETYTPAFIEAPHVEQLQEHIHRMGLVIARCPDPERGS
ncbi:class I SAM-dependent methyltransferase [Actinomadura fulvescens]|uniref:class I SAM-dependent methyltransferase n=1 Tax=Actinomadura fulvescens TaxID=46160 RepID=UPI0031D2B0FA